MWSDENLNRPTQQPIEPDVISFDRIIPENNQVETAISHNSEKHRSKKIIASIAAIALAAAAFGVYHFKHNSTTSANPTAGSAFNPNKACQDLTLTDNAFSFGHNNFLQPAAGSLTNNNSVAKYTQSWFNDGPIGGPKADASSIAAIYAAMGYPATSTGTNNSYNYTTEFNQAYNQMTSSNTQANHANAVAFCKTDALVVAETIGSGYAIAPGQQYIALNAQYGHNKITGMYTSSETASASSGIDGAIFKVQNAASSNKIKGFNEVVITRSGQTDIIGASAINAKNVSNNNNSSPIIKKNNPSTGNSKNSSGGGTAHEQSTNQGSSSNNSGHGTKVNPGGPNPEKNPALTGPANTLAPSQPGGVPESTHGTNPTPGPGTTVETTTTAVEATTTVTSTTVPITTPTTSVAAIKSTVPTTQPGCTQEPC